ncbi:hypothetical protein GRF59_14645 [Paenibacillus sp. HJL G12]|uniref:Uncharacterized protein n=1 Tax=Paenibacillus dendrobii TaxID=2691084 RepID=A0A7X3LH80_9BACL|nr:hypothetical protein [Paenibacillus dendrobii]MWV44857.1 hypothetical protein [Paenibacillus dendrobii]
MFKNEMLNTLVGVQKEGVHIFLTEEGWNVFVALMSNEETFYREIKEITTTNELAV